MKLQFKPRHDYVIVKMVRVESTEGGVELPESSQESKQWRVVSKGSDVKTSLCVGDIVVVGGPVEGSPETNGYLMYQIPGALDLFLIQDRNIIAVSCEPEQKKS